MTTQLPDRDRILLTKLADGSCRVAGRKPGGERCPTAPACWSARLAGALATLLAGHVERVSTLVKLAAWTGRA